MARNVCCLFFRSLYFSTTIELRVICQILETCIAWKTTAHGHFLSCGGFTLNFNVESLIGEDNFVTRPDSVTRSRRMSDIRTLRISSLFWGKVRKLRTRISWLMTNDSAFILVFVYYKFRKKSQQSQCKHDAHESVMLALRNAIARHLRSWQTGRRLKLATTPVSLLMFNCVSLVFVLFVMYQ